MRSCRERPALKFHAEHAARIYRLAPVPKSGVQRGTFVAVCAPLDAAELGRRRGYLAAGPCSADTELLLKVVAAVAGDVVAVSVNGVVVNGHPCRAAGHSRWTALGAGCRGGLRGATGSGSASFGSTPITLGAGTRVIGVRQRWYTLRLGQSRYSCPVQSSVIGAC